MRHLDEYTSFTEKGTFSILCVLANADRCLAKMDELRKYIPNFQTLRERVRLMNAEGLVTVTTLYEGGKTTWVELTPKGMQVASMALVLSNTVDSDKPIQDHVLNSRYADFVIRYLAKEPRKFNDLAPYVTNFRTLEQLMSNLESAGIISIEEVEGRPRNYKVAKLTVLGNGVAVTLDKTYAIIVKDRKPLDDFF